MHENAAEREAMAAIDEPEPPSRGRRKGAAASTGRTGRSKR
jgi:hypothetical protein